MKEIDKLAWLCVRDGKLLCARSKGKSLFYVPGGKREAAEDDQAALIREIKEELSVDLLTDSLHYQATFRAPADGKPDALVKLSCYSGEYQGELCAASEIEELRWVGYPERELTSLATIAVLEWLHSQALLEL